MLQLTFYYTRSFTLSLEEIAINSKSSLILDTLDRIHSTSFSSHLTDVLNKLVLCYTRPNGFLVPNTLALLGAFVNCEENEVLWIRPLVLSFGVPTTSKTIHTCQNICFTKEILPNSADVYTKTNTTLGI
jgi:hypothetical protein